MEWWQSSSADSRGGGQAMARAASAYRGGSVRFMVAIDNFEHVALAYGAAVAARAVGEVRRSIGGWFGDQAEIHYETGGIFYGTMRPARLVAGRSGADEPVTSGVQATVFSTTRTLVNPPLVLLKHEQRTIALAVSGSWALHDGRGDCDDPDPRRGFDGSCRVPHFGDMPQRGAGWAERYRADMAVACALLETLAREQGEGGAGLAGAQDAPIAECSAGEPRRGARAEQLVFAWRPVRSAQAHPEVLFYEMCPQLVAADGRRRDLADLRPALERLGFSCAVDRYLVGHALDLLEAEPDLAVAVQISAQSACACARWGGLFRRLTGSRSVARRLTLAITETASFPDFAEAIQFVSRVQAFGGAVAVDNFGLGYTSIRELLALSPDLVCIDPFFVRYGVADVPEGAALAHLAGLAGLLAKTVVIKGVTTERHSRIALDAGVRWQQGDFLGAAALGRPWAGSAGAVRCHLPDRATRRPRAA